MSSPGRRVNYNHKARPALAWKRVAGVPTRTNLVAPTSYELVHEGVTYRVAFHTDARSRSWRAWKDGVPISKSGGSPNTWKDERHARVWIEAVIAEESKSIAS